MMMTPDQRLIEWDWLAVESEKRRWTRLHHSELTAEEASGLVGYGYAEGLRLTCGRDAPYACIPGIFTRMSELRCQRCCDRLGFPHGKGSPKNDHGCRPLVEKRFAA